MPAFDPEHEYAIGELEASVTFSNSHAQTGKEFATIVETKLATVADNLSGEVTLTPNHDNTGVIIGSG